MKNLKLRTQTKEDLGAVLSLIEKAFENEAYSDHKEQYLVKALTKSVDFVNKFSIVAEIDQQIVGYILLSKVKITNDSQSYDSLALAPVVVDPNYQKSGIGKALINESHERAKHAGYSSVIVMGHEDYYPKFGYKEAAEFGIKAPFEVPSKNFMALELQKGGLLGIHGKVVYPKEFMEH